MKRSSTHPNIKLVPKKSIITQQKPKLSIPILSIDEVRQQKPDILFDLNPSPLSPKEIIPQPTTPAIDGINSPTFDFKTLPSISPSQTPTPNPINNSTSTKKIVCRVVTVSIVILICSVAAVLPPILILNLRQNATNASNSTSNLTQSICQLTTCIGSETPYRTSSVTALFTFDQNCNDLYGLYIGIPYGTSTLIYDQSTAYVRSSIDLRSNKYQYVKIPYMNFRQQSFTIQLWYLVYGSGSAIDYGLFSQCGSDLICLGLSIRNGRITLSFDSMNNSANILTGTIINSPSYWIHVTVVYNASLRKQFIYVNGRMDAISSGTTDPYQGTSFGSNTYIGLSSSINYTSSYMFGAIDHVTISIGAARTGCQIYNDATLFVYYPFDSIDPLLDRSSNLIHGIGGSLTTGISGRFKEAISFDYNTSYFQAPSYPTIRFNDVPFSISLWVKPSTIINGGSLVHISSSSNGNGSVCFDLLGFTTSGILVAQLMLTSSNITGVQGTTLPVNTWTHIAVIYSSSNGFRLYINGQLNTWVMILTMTSNFNNYITLGNNSPGLSVSTTGSCLSSPIAGGPFRGAIDEFRLYNRELSMDELCVLING